MKTRTAQLTAIAAIAIAAGIIASPWVVAATSTAASSASSTTTGTSSSYTSQNFPACGQGQGFGRGFDHVGPPGFLGIQNEANLTVGQTITVTSTQGRYQVIGSTSDNGTASGAMTFTVTSKLSNGYTLSITSGSIVVAGTTYTISTGTAQTGPSADSISGQGTTPTGQFLLRGFARGSFAGTSGSLLLDFKTGSTEYAVALTGTVTS